MFEELSVTDGPANESNGRDNYRVYSNEIAPKLVAPWSSPEESKFLFKRRYVSASGSLPQRNKRFVRYKISRSLNFDASTSHNSSSDSGSFHEDKHLTRSAKIMRALNFNSSPSYYGRTKIKRSLNFNLTPSPKRFSRTVKNVRKASRLSSSTSPLASERKLFHSDENTSGSGNGSIIFSSAESIDENQNETPSRQFTKTGSPLNYSTPRNKLGGNSPGSSTFTPLLRSDLKRRIENIMYVSSTPSQLSIKSSTNRSNINEDVVMSTPRNLFRDFSDVDDDRPRTPENIIRLVPESMSAIKKSHKKERSSKRNERCVTQSGGKSQSMKNSNASQMESPELSQLANSTSTPLLSRKYSRSGHYPMYDVQGPTEDETGDDIHHSEDDLSETGSIFDYKSERDAGRDLDEGQMNVDKESMDCAELPAETSEREITQEEEEILPEHPQPETKRTVTPENRLNYLQYVLRDSIKKSHKKIKDDNKKKLFSPKVLGLKFGPPKSEKTDEYSDEREHCLIDSEEKGISAEPDILIEQRVDRAVTPEKINSSRLLLSQFSSVKKSHKKDKHSKILSGFMKRQEYFNRDLESAKDFQKRSMANQDACRYKSSAEDFSSDSDYATNIKNQSGDVESIETREVVKDEALSLDKISPTKRKNLLDELNNSATSNVSCESDVQELEATNAGGNEFHIFTPLKRRRPLTSTFVKEYSCAYLVPTEKDGLSEETVADITLSRCLTPIAKFEDLSPRLEENNSPSTERMGEGLSEQQTCSSNGRSTPRNMSTRALYCGMDSIKKSHKKNKRGSENGNRKLVLSLSTSSQSEENSKEENSVDLLETSRLNSTMDSVDSYHADKSDATQSSMPASSEELVDDENPIATASTTSAEALPTKTPPKYLRTKDYIRLVGNTSIKRSHKKVRQQKRYGEPKTDAQELSDDGSIFDENERITNPEVD